MSLKKVLFNISFFGCLITTYLILKYTHSCDCLSKWVFCDVSISDVLSSDEGKWVVLRSLFAKIALFLFVHSAIIMNIRIFTKKSSPATQEDPDSIKVLNRIISNTVEQSIIFVGLYSYFLFEKAGDRFTSIELLSFASWFVIARVIFSIGYIIGSLLGVPVMRAFGFSLNLVVNILLIELSFCSKTYLTTFFFEK